MEKQMRGYLKWKNEYVHTHVASVMRKGVKSVVRSDGIWGEKIRKVSNEGGGGETEVSNTSRDERDQAALLGGKTGWQPPRPGHPATPKVHLLSTKTLLTYCSLVPYYWKVRVIVGLQLIVYVLVHYSTLWILHHQLPTWKHTTFSSTGTCFSSMFWPLLMVFADPPNLFSPLFFNFQKNCIEV